MNRNIVRSQRAALPVVNQRGIANKKLLSEAESLLKHPVPGCEAAPRNDDVLIWTAVIEGPPKSPYTGGTFFVQLRFNEEYPFTPPNITFLTRIYHCNIDGAGRINLPLTSTDWTPCKKISDILEAILTLMEQCRPDFSLVPELREQFLRKPEEYQTMAKEWTRRYAH